MIRDDWSGLRGAPRWWHLEGGLVVYGILRAWQWKRWKLRLYIHVPDGDRLLTIRPEGVIRLTIPTNEELSCQETDTERD